MKKPHNLPSNTSIIGIPRCHLTRSDRRALHLKDKELFLPNDIGNPSNLREGALKLHLP
jgi:hypothetical protein